MHKKINTNNNREANEQYFNQKTKVCNKYEIKYLC